MYYAINKAGKNEDQAQKKLREARQTVKWMPIIAVVVTVVAAFEGILLARHPDMEHLLKLVPTVGAVLYCLSHWKTARATLAGTRDTLPGGTLILGLVLMASGPTLADMWHHRLMALFYPFGAAVLALAVFCLGLVIMEVSGSWQAARRA